MQTALLLFVGGGAGTLARYGVSVWFHSLRWSAGFPWHTFAINVAGSFLLGILAMACKDRPNLLLLLGTGFCGGFTTFSTFSVEGIKLMEDERLGAAIFYLLGSVVAGVAGAWLGMQLVGKPIATVS